MKCSRLALGVSLALFVGWVGYLGVQALSDRRPVVVSTAQLAVAEYDVEADLDGLAGERVKIRAVRWSADDKKPAGEVRVLNLGDVQGYAGPGTYLLPLVRKGRDFEVAGLPIDPGNMGRALPKPRIYPHSPSVRRQWDEIRGP